MWSWPRHLFGAHRFLRVMRWVVSMALAGSVATTLAIVTLAPAAPPLPESGSYDLAADASAHMLGPDGANRVGWSVAPAGDVNGDGTPDAVVGAPHADVAGAAQAGAAYVVFGPVA